MVVVAVVVVVTVSVDVAVWASYPNVRCVDVVGDVVSVVKVTLVAADVRIGHC